jgi:hypothetical protein
MRELNLRNITMMALVAIALIQNGAQLFALSIIARTVSKAPPRSFAILSGEYAYDSRIFWETVPPITLLIFVTALIANWKTARRKFLLVALGLFIAGGLFAGLYLEPMFDAMISQGYADHVDPVMQREAANWYMIDWAVWAVGFAACLILLLALAQPASRQESS